MSTKAYRLKSGELLYPYGMKLAPGLWVDGHKLASPGTPEFNEWAVDAVKAGQAQEEEAEIIRKRQAPGR